MLRKLLTTLLFMCFFAATAVAQNGSIEGTVTDAKTGDQLPGVNIFIPELNTGAVTDSNGKYTIENLEPGTYSLRATFVGYKTFTTEVDIGNEEITQNISMSADVTGLDEVVVTGVGQGTQEKKLGFSVAKVDEDELQQVPASDVGSALYGKTSGVTIVNASGDPSSAPNIRLRGSTSINGDQEPLIIVDGVITDGNLQDINMQDVKSVEVVKGASAAALYGSLAGSGVVQIITKSGSSGERTPSFTVRSEYGVSEIAKDYPVTTKHPWKENNVQLTSNDKFIDSWPGYGSFDSDRKFDNDFPVTYDNIDAIFSGKPYNTNYIRIGGTKEDFSYSGSFENLNQSGVVENLDDYTRNTFRFNADYNSSEKFQLKFRGSYVKTEYPYFQEQGQGSNYFYSALTTPPYLSLKERNPNTGEYSNRPTGYGIASSNFQNPLYVAANRKRGTDRKRIIGGVTATYDVTDWLTIKGQQSLDKRIEQNTQHTPVGYKTPTPSTTFNDGYQSFENIYATTSITQASLNFNNSFADGLFNLDGVLKYIHENRQYERDFSEGYDYAASGLVDIGATDPENLNVFSEDQPEIVDNFIANAKLDYQDKIIIDGMIRRDGSSLFGEDNRYSFYYRGSLAYRLTEDVDINNINELKLRASYGTTGQRPPWSAQYETYTVSGTTLVPDQLGNNEISPSVVAETEFGVDMTFLDRYSFTANYAITNVKDDYILAPLSGTSAFSAQYQNIGELHNTSLEFMLGGQVISKKDQTWNVNLSFSKTTQEITDLGGIPPFTRGTDFDAAIDLFRFQKDVPYGTMYGNKLISSVDQLTVNGNGIVQNISGGYQRSDFTTNALGHVVLKQDKGTQAERPMYLVDKNGNKEITDIGNSNPDFTAGLSTTYNYKGLGVHMTWGLSYGGEVYNYTRELMYNRYLHKDLEHYTTDLGLDPQYALASDGLYNASEASSHFVEDATFLKLREASISYTFGSEILGSVGKYIQSIKLSAVGRNLLTFTGYSGYDPEVALRSNSTNFRIDEFAYPNFRTYSGAVEVRF